MELREAKKEYSEDKKDYSEDEKEHSEGHSDLIFMLRSSFLGQSGIIGQLLISSIY